MGNPYISNGTVNIPVANGNLAVTLSNGDIKLTTSTGASATANVTEGSLTLSAGAVSVTLAENGSDSLSVSSGIVTGTLNFTTSGTITGASVALNSSTFGLPATAQIAISDTSGAWTGTVSGGLAVSSAIPGATWLNNEAKYSYSFDPTVKDPCTIVPAGFGSTCSMLESSQAGGVTIINQNELNQLRELDNTSDLENPESSSGDQLLAGNDSAGISYDQSSGAYGGVGAYTGGGAIIGYGGGYSGYAAARSPSIGRSPASGTNIANIGSGTSHIARAASTPVSSPALALLLGEVAANTNQSYWAIGSADGETLVGANHAVIGVDANLNGSVFSTTPNGAGQAYESFNSSGTITGASINGKGESVTINSGDVSIAPSSSATVYGASDQIYMGNLEKTRSGYTRLGSDTLVVNGVTDTVGVVGTGNTVTFTQYGSYVVDTIYGSAAVNATDSTINFVLSPGQTLASVGDTVVGGGDTVKVSYSSVRLGSGIVANPQLTGPSLIQAMASYAPTSPLASDTIERTPELHMLHSSSSLYSSLHSH